MLKEGEWPLSMSGYRTKRRGGAVISSATVGLLAVGGDYRSRTWCLSSGFRLGLRAKVAVI